MMIVGGTRIPFFLEHEKRDKYRKGIAEKLLPYERYYTSPLTTGDMRLRFPSAFSSSTARRSKSGI